MDLTDLVCAVFSFQGFALVGVNRKGAGAASGVVVRRGPLDIAIAVLPGALPLNEAVVAELVAELAERKGARHLIAYGGAASGAARTAALEAGAILWDRERLLGEAGTAMVGLADPDPFVPRAGAEAAALGAAALRDLTVPRAPAAAPPVRGATTLHPSRPVDREAVLGALIPALSEEGARAAAAAALTARVLRLALEWAPAYLIDFHVEVEVHTARGSEDLLSSGTLLLFASGGEVEDVEQPLEVVAPESVLAADARSKAAQRRRLPASAAKQRAREEALARALRTVERVREDGSATVIERQAWRPKSGGVDLVVRGLLLVPLFLAETEGGAVTVNAATGRIVRVAPFAGGPAARGGPR